MEDTETDKYVNQELNAKQVQMRAELNFGPLSQYQPADGDTVFTFDIQYVDGTAHVACDVSKYPEQSHQMFVLKVDAKGEYIPGYFAFYEGPLLLALLNKVREHVEPEVIFVDGHGMAHPRKFGLACYIGVKTGLPTIGYAKKTLLPYHGELAAARGSVVRVELEGEPVGLALRSQKDIKPVFISQGNKIGLSQIKEMVLKLSPEFRLMEPLRRADHAARAFAKGESGNWTEVT